LQKQGIHISVTNCPADKIPAGTDVVVCQSILASRARKSAPDAELVVITDFLGDSRMDALFERIKEASVSDIIVTGNDIPTEFGQDNDSVLKLENIVLGLESETKEDAIRRAGKLLVAGGYVEPGYVSDMLEREKITTTYLGMGIAIPHGTSEAKEKIKRTGIVFLQYPRGVSFGDEKACLVIGIAGKGDEHIDILARISSSLDDEAVLQQLVTTSNKHFILEKLEK
jgi:PTS system mannitol-specific IIC component